MAGSKQRWIWFVLAAIVGLAAFSMYGDVQKVKHALWTFSWRYFLLALVLAGFNYVIRFARWHWYLALRNMKVPWQDSAQIFLAGFALSISPGKVGELIKSYYLQKLHGIPIESSAGLVIAERLTDLIALGMLALIGVSVYGVGGKVAVTCAAVIVMGYIVLAWRPLGIRTINLMTMPRFSRRFRDRLSFTYDELGPLLRLGPLVIATLLGAVAWFAECVGFALICHGFPGAHVPWGLATLIYATTTVAGALSFLPGGLLVTEAAMTGLLVQTSQGWNASSALTATLLTRFATLWFAVVIGIVAATFLQRRIGNAESKLA